MLPGGSTLFVYATETIWCFPFLNSSFSSIYLQIKLCIEVVLNKLHSTKVSVVYTSYACNLKFDMDGL